ncbi:MAG: hypothetical protein OXF62_06370 [Caldilineaceae bacterium]|nr:hypothetical protein [Caldilineaceae bacterium]MCY4117650.1 hypothetical protein [Caldilineaceae bacterium]MDE0183530.1 hypothetical protein [Caldilineaceae bacterium]
MTKLRRQLVPLVVVLALALSGCGPIAGDNGPAGGEQVAQATEQPAAEPTATVEPTATPEPEPTEVAIGPPPAFREEIIATDPQTVVLGQGHPQVIEFFAFW